MSRNLLDLLDVLVDHRLELSLDLVRVVSHYLHVVWFYDRDPLVHIQRSIGLLGDLELV